MCRYAEAEIVFVNCPRNPQHKLVKRLFRRCEAAPKPGPRCASPTYDPSLGTFLQSSRGGPCKSCRDSGTVVGSTRTTLPSETSRRTDMPSKQSQRIPLDLSTLHFLAAGKSGAIYTISEDAVLKEFHDENDLNTEQEALELLNGHPNIVTFLGRASKNALIVERGECLRVYLKATNSIPWPTKAQWIKDAAEGLKHMHENDVVHADIGCHNMILKQNRLKYIDFEGCSCRGKEAMSAYEWFSYPQSSASISRQTDLFAFGCALFEIVTGRIPHEDLDGFEDRRERVTQRLAQGQYLDVRHLPFGDLMQACWLGEVRSATNLVDRLQQSDHKPYISARSKCLNGSPFRVANHSDDAEAEAEAKISHGAIGESLEVATT